MVDELDGAIAVGPFFDGDLEPPADRLLAHGLVRAQRDHHVEGGGLSADLPVDRLEKHPHRCGARAVGHDQEHPFARVVGGGQYLRDDVRDLFGGHRFIRIGDGGEGTHGRIRSSGRGNHRPRRCPCR
jgi:hypothetical protein